MIENEFPAARALASGYHRAEIARIAFAGSAMGHQPAADREGLIPLDIPDPGQFEFGAEVHAE
jgi:hypothetical protein